MNREMFVRVSTTVLRQMGDPAAGAKAEAIAAQMDVFAAVLGDAPMPPAAAPPLPVPPAFPGLNPEAVAPVTNQQDYADGMAGKVLPPPQESLIIPATRIPDMDEVGRQRQSATPPVRSLRPQARMKVEDLSQLIQERTPSQLTFDVPMDDGGQPRRITFVRNVISMHSSDSVQLVYYPANATMSGREATEVMAVLHVDEVPIDLAAVLKKLAGDAVNILRPRRIPQSAMPAPTPGPRKHSDDTYQPMDKSDDQTPQTVAVFNSLG